MAGNAFWAIPQCIKGNDDRIGGIFGINGGKNWTHSRKTLIFEITNKKPGGREGPAKENGKNTRKNQSQNEAV